MRIESRKTSLAEIVKTTAITLGTGIALGFYGITAASISRSSRPPEMNWKSHYAYRDLNSKKDLVFIPDLSRNLEMVILSEGKNTRVIKKGDPKFRAYNRIYQEYLSETSHFHSRP